MIVINFKKLLHNGAEEHDPLELSRRTGIATSNTEKEKDELKANYPLSICDVLDITPKQLDG
ncbi:MAG: hypothetical protein ACLS8T_31210 [Anaerobutyricum sp.]